MINTASTLVQPYTIILCVVKNNEYDEIHLDKEKNQTFQPFLERERERTLLFKCNFFPLFF
jgi:hypothetical protein